MAVYNMSFVASMCLHWPNSGQLFSWLAQLVGYQTVVLEVEGSCPGRTITHGLKIN